MLFALASVQRAASSNNNNKKIIIIIRAITFSPDFSLAKKNKIKGRVFPKYFSPQSSVCESHTFRSCSCSVKGGFKARDAPLTNPHSEESPANLNGGVHTNQGLALKDGPTGCPGVLSESVSAGLAMHRKKKTHLGHVAAFQHRRRWGRQVLAGMGTQQGPWGAWRGWDGFWVLPFSPCR